MNHNHLRKCRSTLVAAILTGSFLIAGCDHGTDTVNPPAGIEEKLSSIQTNIFTPSCALSNCHVGPNAMQGLDLSAGKSYASLVDVASAEVPTMKRVAAGNADDSYLIA